MRTWPMWLCISGILTAPFWGTIASQAHAWSSPSDRASVEELAKEVGELGWVVYSARSKQGDWDLAACRPDGSQPRWLTRTADHHEFSPQYSRDYQQLLYRQLPRAETIDDNRHGAQGALVLARADASQPRLLGGQGELPWASWGPEGRQIASLSREGIRFVDLSSGTVTRQLQRQGFFQQLVWSPDGHWLGGVANAFGTSWSIARMDARSGEISAVNRVHCCTPDWFPDSRQLIFSWRPPGRDVNDGYGWTQLWRADPAAGTRALVYAEDGRHVYGGHVSPDGRYVLFTGNMQEDGDPGNAGAPMGLMRLEDGPLIGGDSDALRTVHPDAGTGPVLSLPTGWEPCWIPTDPFGQADASALELDRLRSELSTQGWLVMSVPTSEGDWDLVLMRPDGSERTPLTRTREHHETGPRFSRDGQRLLYYRQSRDDPIDNNRYGTYSLIVADADGRNGMELGKGYSWASWGPDNRHIACLTPQGIEVIDMQTRAVVRRIPRQGIVSQLVWSPDGKSWTGTANGLGPYWTIGRLDEASGTLNLVSEPDRYNCTSDWMPDSRGILLARGIVPEQGGRAELALAQADGSGVQTLFADSQRHVYGACASPDGKYVVFTRSVADLGPVDAQDITVSIIRLADAPVLNQEDASLRKRFPDAQLGPRFDLGVGWEPDWTYADVLEKRDSQS